MKFVVVIQKRNSFELAIEPVLVDAFFEGVDFVRQFCKESRLMPSDKFYRELDSCGLAELNGCHFTIREAVVPKIILKEIPKDRPRKEKKMELVDF